MFFFVEINVIHQNDRSDLSTLWVKTGVYVMMMMTPEMDFIWEENKLINFSFWFQKKNSHYFLTLFTITIITFNRIIMFVFLTFSHFFSLFFSVSLFQNLFRLSIQPNQKNNEWKFDPTVFLFDQLFFEHNQINYNTETQTHKQNYYFHHFLSADTLFDFHFGSLLNNRSVLLLISNRNSSFFSNDDW